MHKIDTAHSKLRSFFQFNHDVLNKYITRGLGAFQLQGRSFFVCSVLSIGEYMLYVF